MSAPYVGIAESRNFTIESIPTLNPSVRPSEPPTFDTITIDKIAYDYGEHVVVTFSIVSAGSWDWVAIYPGWHDPNLPLPTRSEMWLYTCNSQDCGFAVKSGSLTFGPADPDEGGRQDWPLAIGEYRAYLLPISGYAAIAYSNLFNVTESSIITDKTAYEYGEHVVVTFSTVSAGSLDWVAIYRDKHDPTSPLPYGSEMWLYTCNSQDCTNPVSDGALTFGPNEPDEEGGQVWPLGAGEYRAYLLPTNGYSAAAYSEVFIVTGGNKTECGRTDTEPSSSTHTVPVEGAEISTVMFGSCFKPGGQIGTTLWEHVASSSSNGVWVWLGDNVYSDGRSMEYKRTQYNEARDNAYYKEFVIDRKLPVTGTWDDHDYASNNGGRHYSCRKESQDEFVTHFNLPEDDPRHPSQGKKQRRGIYHSYMFQKPNGNNGIHLITLDVRYHRSPTFDRYGYCEGSTSDMLGVEQWAWLMQELARPSEIKVIGTGIQVLPPTYNGRNKEEYCAYDKPSGTFDAAIAGVGETYEGWDGTYYESWAEIPQSRTKLLKLCEKAIIESTTKRIIFISGDQHWAEIMAKKMPAVDPRNARVLYEVTASGIDQRWNEAVLNSNRLRIRSADNAGNGIFHEECNFPFTVEGIEYNDCTLGDKSKAWCRIGAGVKEWGYCLDADKEILLRSLMTYQDQNKCTDNYHHTCTAQANYGSIEADWDLNTVTLNIFTPYESDLPSSSAVLQL